MHKLCHLLNKKGYESFVNVKVVNKEWKTPTLFDKKETRKNLIIDGAIVVYPEWQDNVLYSKSPISWQLQPFKSNVPFSFVFSQSFDEKAPLLKIFRFEEYFNDKNCGEKEGSLLYFGKMTNHPEYYNMSIVNKEKKITMIAHNFPKDRKGLAKLLRKSEILYTADPLTALSSEARLCGCIVIYIGNNMPEIYKKTIIPDGYAFNATVEEIARAKESLAEHYAKHIKLIGDENEQVENFIKISQEYWL